MPTFIPTKLVSSIALLCLLLLNATRTDAVEFANDETIALIGDGLIEQEQYYGWIEIALTASMPDKNLKFRNLGWSGDTPAGQSRFGLSLLQAGREPADEGWKQLVAQIELVKPSMVVFGYGMASSLELGSQGVEQFKAEYDKLIAEVRRINPNAKLIFLSPISRADQDPHSETLQAYSATIEAIAKQNSAAFVNLMAIPREGQFHQDPIRLNEQGYRKAASLIVDALKLPTSDWESNPNTAMLRSIVLRKNEWWFHRSRPANMAYVFGFRKHEQGQNAVEIPQFDELIAKEEAQIHQHANLKLALGVESPTRTESKYAKFTPQPTPEFTVAEGFEVTLWAENPQLNKPIHMNFDPQGRLWVASSEAYPMIEVGQAAPDRIVVLEDTTGAGKADKATVFADGLLIPTGVLPGNGGVYVAQSTDLLFLKDTDGDGKADTKTRVLSGFGTEDTHHNLHTLLWGPDGRLYMNQSVYTRTDAETPQGVTRLKAGGGFRMNANNLRTDIFFRGLWNSWGHQFDRYGNSFLTDGAGFEGIAYTFPGAMFNPTPNARRQMELISPGRWPKFASKEIIYGDSFPATWQGSIITCDFRANRVTRFSLSERGAGFVTQQEEDLLRTAATTFRPIDVKQGPDGALYIADWSNPIINHGEVDFRDPRRDRWHGRIWRVTWKGKPTIASSDVSNTNNTSAPLAPSSGRGAGGEGLFAQSTQSLYANLLNNDRYTREQSRRLLIERGSEAIEALPNWIASQSEETALLQGLWMHQAFNQIDRDLLSRLLNAKDHNVRSAAVRVLADWSSPKSDVNDPLEPSDALKLYASAIADEHPRVRLEAVRGLGLLGSFEAASLALQVLERPMDNFLDYALWLTVNESSNELLQQLSKDQVISGFNAKHLEYVMTAIEPSLSAKVLNDYLNTHELTSTGEGPWIELIGKAGDQSQVSQLFDRIVAGNFDTPAMVRALSAMLDAHRGRGLGTGNPDRLVALLQSSEPEIQAAAARLAGQWKLAQAVKPLSALASNGEANSASRRATIASLRQIQSPEAVDELTKLVELIPAGDLRVELMAALAATDLDRAAPAILKAISQSGNEQEAQQLWRAVLNVGEAGKRLAPKLADSGLTEMAAQAGMRVATEGRQEQELVAALVPLSGQMITAEKLTPERVAEYVKLVAEKGDPHRGEDIYRRRELACATCHAIGGVGGKVGPDMTSLGASAPIDYIIESLFVPNAKIKEGYHSTIVATEEGQVITGIELSADEAETVLRTAANEIVRVPTPDIVGKRNGISLMPSGIIDRLPQQDQIDLIRFITALGKQGDFDASRGGVARVYQMLAGTHVLEQGGTDRIIDGTLQEGWQPLQARVNGRVDKSLIDEMTKTQVHVSLVHIYLRTKVEVATDRTATFTLANTKNAAVWVDGQPHQVQTDAPKSIQSFESKLASGTHTVLVRLDARDLPPSWSLKSADVTFAVE